MRRTRKKPVEQLRSTWTSTQDLEETLASMFQAPATLIVSTPVDTTPVDTDNLNVEKYPSQQCDSIVSTPVDTIPVEPGVETIPANTPSLESILQENARLFISRSRKRLFKPSRPSDAHTDGEDRLYQFMWENGRRYEQGTRVYVGSMTLLSKAIGRDARNTRPVVESLIRKLSIEIGREQDSRTGQPRLYFVFGYTKIGERRRSAGLEWALKNKGIQLLSAAEAQRLAAAELVSTPVNTPPVDTTQPTVFTPVDTPFPTPVQTRVSTPVDTSELPYRRKESEKDDGETSSLVTVLRRYIPDVDDDAARHLWQKCRQNAPNAAIEDVIHFVDVKAGKPGIRMPLGFLLTAVPKCFVGESYRQFRAEKEQNRRAETSRDRMFAAEILNSSEADDEQREWALSVLRGRGPES